MSRASRLAIGIVALLCGAFFLMICLPDPLLPRKPLPIYLLTAFCFLIAFICFAPNASPMVNRLAGGAIFAVLATEAIAAHSGSETRPDSFRQTGAIEMLWALGIPAVYFMIFGRLPTWSKMANVFSSIQARK